MAFKVRDSAWWTAVLCVMFGTLTVPLQARAADVGGFIADQQKASAMAAAKAGDEACPQVIARAATDNSALAAYRAALCYLQADTPDVVAAKAWLARSSELGFMPAQRLLRTLLIAEAGAHSAAQHCHALGEGQQICHGGTAAQPVASATTK